MWRLIFAIPLIAHGLAHMAGLLGTVTTDPAGYPNRPWVFSADLTLHSPAGQAFAVL